MAGLPERQVGRLRSSSCQLRSQHMRPALTPIPSGTLTPVSGPIHMLSLVSCPRLYLLGGVSVQPVPLGLNVPKGKGGISSDTQCRAGLHTIRCSRKTLESFDFIESIFASS